jgi:hypothetical protein
MATQTIPLKTLEVNRSQALISKIRRIAKRHNLRLVKNRSLWQGYKLQSTAVIATYLTLEKALDICRELDGAR